MGRVALVSTLLLLALAGVWLWFRSPSRPTGGPLREELQESAPSEVVPIAEPSLSAPVSPPAREAATEAQAVEAARHAR